MIRLAVLSVMKQDSPPSLSDTRTHSIPDTLRRQNQIPPAATSGSAELSVNEVQGREALSVENELSHRRGAADV